LPAPGTSRVPIRLCASVIHFIASLLAPSQGVIILFFASGDNRSKLAVNVLDGAIQRYVPRLYRGTPVIEGLLH
jgi:hypothetical protein